MARLENQDSYIVFEAADKTVFGLVADGMGGHKGGAAASLMAVWCIKKRLMADYRPHMATQALAELMKQSFAQANAAIFERSLQDETLSGMGTTATLAAVRSDQAVIAHVGDSRAYLIGEGIARQITTDHTLVQDLLNKGEITADEAKTHPQKHIIMQALGTEKKIDTDIYHLSCGGQIILLCSDGLTNMVSDADIARTMNTAQSLKDGADKLIGMANSAGGQDNITVVAICDETVIGGELA